jgi:hypothetical protein
VEDFMIIAAQQLPAILSAQHLRHLSLNERKALVEATPQIRHAEQWDWRRQDLFGELFLDFD